MRARIAEADAFLTAAGYGAGVADDSLLSSGSDRKRLTDRLARIREVSRYGEEEAEALVHALGDLEEAYRAYIEQELPRLLADDLTDEEALDALWDIGEDVAHISYHLNDSQFLRRYAERGRIAADEPD